MTTTHLNFSIDGEFFTNHVRQRWHEGHCVKTYRMLRDNLEGITDDAIFAVLSGKSKLVNTGDSLHLEDDNWSAEDQHWIGYPTPSYEAMLDRMEEWEKFDPHFKTIKVLGPLAHAANGMPLKDNPNRRTSASPIGLVHPEYLVYMLCKMLPQPTDAEWSAFWDKHTETMRKELGIKSGEDSITSSLRKLREKLGSPEEDDQTDEIVERIQQERKPCPDPDPDLGSEHGYVLRDGKFYPCVYMGHKWLSEVLLEKLGIEYVDSEQKADDLGWVRISVSPFATKDDLCILCMKRPSEEQRRTVEQWCLKNNQSVPRDFTDE